MFSLDDVRLAECTVGLEFSEKPDDDDSKPRRVRIDTEVPEKWTDEVAVKCIYSQEPSREVAGWRIAYWITLSGVDEDTPASDIAIATVGAVHPYVRQLLQHLGALMMDESLGLPPSPPMITRKDLKVTS